ncbi:Glycosyltransferase involved in cell wall bisynthesis [Halomicrobium zhouii]|uniref:Glycosyltransferase involved in cell wall bisynthesis n=1 Tax=Halomicrobium zhouii TaxID=767519 RepID=A0A1I6LSU3_9EURY|nr:glycosyltransferase family 4 protein [Halomicrobium zhouii]SFS06567.1 Glycosyltransferase involved in cell wall bisynthesis [Halomicrobium zhouii]
MRILFLTEERISFSDALVRGGAIHVRNVVQGLRERRHDVLLLDWNENPERNFQRSVDPLSRFVEGPTRTAVHATHVARRHDVDVIVSKTRKTYLPGLIASRAAGVPHVVHVGSSLDRPVAGAADRLNVASMAARLRAPHDAYFVVCEYIRDQLLDRGVHRDRIFDVSNAVDTERFHPNDIPKPLDDDYHKRIESLDGDFLLGYVGGLQPYKGLDDLATAFRSTEADCEVIVAGDGPQRSRLERSFGDAATFLGSIPYEQIPALYHEMDVFVLPSHTEGLPRVVLEAQATATPVIATRVGGIPEVVEDGETGLLCEPKRPSDLAIAIERLATDTSERERLGVNGRDVVQGELSWEATYDRYERYLDQVVG